MIFLNDDDFFDDDLMKLYLEGSPKTFWFHELS